MTTPEETELRTKLTDCHERVRKLRATNTRLRNKITVLEETPHLPGKMFWGPEVEKWRHLATICMNKYCQRRFQRDATEYEIDMAMAIIHFESGGNHLIRSGVEWIGTPPPGYDGTPETRATGLCQHVPAYWKDRSRAAGYENWSILDPLAQLMVMAWLVYDGWHPDKAPNWNHWTGAHVGVRGSKEKAVEALAPLYKTAVR